MRVLVTGGGTAGHINPALAIAQTIRSRQKGAEILYVGTPGGMEARLVPQAGFAFRPFEARGFMRNRISIQNLKYNVKAVGNLMTSTRRARAILEDFKPDLVVGTGGYVTGPLLRTAAKLGIPTATHESNAAPGVTTKLLAPLVDVVLLANEAAKRHLPAHCTTVVTGNPIREAFIYADRDQSRRELGIPDGMPCLLSFGGSLGAKRINEAIADVIAWHVDGGSIHHIHATGRYGVDYLPELLAARGVAIEGHPHLVIREYIDDMPRCFAAADLIICRAGASTISELQAAGRGSILIPSPNVAENHQYYNARVLADDDAAVLIEERDLTGARLCEEIRSLIHDPERLHALGRNARKHAILDANDRIYRELMRLMAGGDAGSPSSAAAPNAGA